MVHEHWPARWRRGALLAAGAVAVLLALPAIASADDYCVTSGPCTGPNTFTTLTDAVSQAATHAGLDTIHLPAGTFASPPGGVGDSVGNPLRIVGAGRDVTGWPAVAGFALDAGRLGRRALEPGAYKATIVATDAGGASAPRTISFKVVTAK